MRHTSTLARLLAATLFTGAAAAMAADPSPAPAPAPAPAEQVAQAQTAGDATLATQAQAALQQDKDLQALPLTVSSSNDGVVVVRGAAPNANLAQKAIKLVQSLPGVKEVRNEIKVG